MALLTMYRRVAGLDTLAQCTLILPPSSRQFAFELGDIGPLPDRLTDNRVGR